MPDTLPPAPSRDDLLADLDRLSQGRGLTYGERTRLADTPDAAFIKAQVEALDRRRRWQPVAITGLLLFAIVLAFFAGGAAGDSATWWPARPHGFALLLFLPALATPYLKHRQLSQKLGIYRALRAMAAPTPTA